MSINIPNALQAYGSVKGADGSSVSGAGANTARTGKGVYTLTLDAQLDATDCSVLATVRGPSNRSRRAAHRA